MLLRLFVASSAADVMLGRHQKVFAKVRVGWEERKVKAGTMSCCLRLNYFNAAITASGQQRKALLPPLTWSLGSRRKELTTSATCNERERLHNGRTSPLPRHVTWADGFKVEGALHLAKWRMAFAGSRPLDGVLNRENHHDAVRDRRAEEGLLHGPEEIDVAVRTAGLRLRASRKDKRQAELLRAGAQSNTICTSADK